ncbi:hypothetical protein TNCV_1162551 [Trichonephila clavipes]|nr:hypothetical protein TNCV_1162551 [Trichonephila clavipes]
MGDFTTYAKNADMHYMYGRANGNGRAACYECITRSFLIDDCRITELSSCFINNFVKHICSTSSDMMLVDKVLYTIQAWMKTF